MTKIVLAIALAIAAFATFRRPQARTARKTWDMAAPAASAAAVESPWWDTPAARSGRGDQSLSGDEIMSSINAGSIVALAVAVALLGLGAVGSAAAQPVAAPVASPECLTNRYEPVVSETDARHLGRLERGEARRTTGLLGLMSCRTSLAPRALPLAS
jgi:hypothetical protein